MKTASGSLKWVAEAEELLLNGYPDKVLGLLDDLPADLDELSQRIMLHLRAQALIYLGDLEGAKSNLLLAERHFGEHVAVLRDLTCVYYQTGETHQWRQSVQRLQGRLGEIGGRLSPQTWIQTKITLGKFLEEDGRIAEAAEAYQHGFVRAKQSERADLVHLALVQLLRIEALFNRGPELGAWYRDLTTLASRFITFDLMLEKEHTLMLTELELVGPEHAWARAERLLQNPLTQPPDRRLVIADYICEALVRSLPLPGPAKTLAGELENGDAFEREIFVVTQTFDGDQSASIRRLQEAASEMSWASYLRLLTLHHQISPRTETRTEIANRLTVLMSSLTPASRHYWMKRIQTRVFRDNLSFSFQPDARQIQFQGKTLDLSKKRTLCSVFTLLSQRGSVDVDEMIQHLWQSEFSPEHLHRLRMAVHRLNALLFELSAIHRVIEMTADRVSFKSNIRVDCAG